MNDMTIREKAIAAFLCATDGYAALYESAANKGFDVYESALASCAAGEWLPIADAPLMEHLLMFRLGDVRPGWITSENDRQWWMREGFAYYAEIHPRKGE